MEPVRVLKTYNFYGNSLYSNFQWRNNRIPCSFFEQVNAAEGVALRHFGQLCYDKVDNHYWLSFSLNKVNRYSHINSKKKKEIHCPSVSLTKWRLRTIQLTLTVFEHNGGMMFNHTSGSLLNTPSLQCVLFCAGRQSVNLMKRVIFLWLSVTK